MRDTYLEVTFRKGKPLAAYLYFAGTAGTAREPVARTEPVGEGLVADYDSAGRPVGLEVISPSSATVSSINNALEALHQKRLNATELAPLAMAV